jgi:transcriptional regulator with XRE-family HTH domain
MTIHTNARYVKSARTAMELSPAAFGEKLGVTRQTIWRYESGDPVPRAVLIAIKALLDGHAHKGKRATQ